MKKLALILITGWHCLQAQVSQNISFLHTDKTVYGVITKPSGSGPFPLIILAPGSGAMDRDGTVQLIGANAACLYPGLLNKTIKSYKQLGDALTAEGYAVLRYNKLEYTYSSNPGTISFEKLWLPVESAIAYAKARPDIDTTNIILIGHSEGSTLIPFISRKRNDIRALISVAGARTPFDSIYCRQVMDINVQCGGNIAQAQADTSYILHYFHNIRNGNYNILTPALFGVQADVWAEYFHATDSVADHYNACNLPTLFLGMGSDFNVPPSELARFQSEVAVTNDFWSLPGLNHFMTPSDDHNMASAVSDTIIYWLRKKGLAPLNTTGISSRRTPGKLTIGPNPCSDILRISSQKDVVTRVSVASISGVRFIDKAFSDVRLSESITLSLEELPAGFYVVTVESGPDVTAFKIVKAGI